MASLTVKPPMGGKGIKTKKISDKGLLFEVVDDKKYAVYPCLPGKVKDIDGDTVIISHKDSVGKDYTSFYEIDGDILVKKNQPVTQSTKIGETEDEVEFRIKEKNSYIDAEKFINSNLEGSDSGSKLSPEQQVKCIIRNIVGVPFKALGSNEYDPCKELYGKKEEPTEPKDTQDDEGPEGEEKKDGGWLETGTKLLGSGNESKKLNEEVNRIKNLIKIL